MKKCKHTNGVFKEHWKNHIYSYFDNGVLVDQSIQTDGDPTGEIEYTCATCGKRFYYKDYRNAPKWLVKIYDMVKKGLNDE